MLKMLKTCRSLSETHGILCAFGDSLRLTRSACRNIPLQRRLKRTARNGNQAELEMLESPLAGGWGRTREELRVPVTNDRSRFEHRRRRFDLDHDDHGSRHRNGRGCVHDDAQRAMIGVALDGMDVRHLDDSQQRKQDKTHD